MGIGARFRDLRKQQKLTMRDLASKSGVGIATLSRIENNLMTGTFKTHQRICEALGIHLADLYKGISSLEDDPVTTAPENREIECFVYNDKASSVILTRNVLKKNMFPVLLTLEAGGSTHIEQNAHGTEKFLFCLEGDVEVAVGERTFGLGPNGVLYFKSYLPHRIINKAVSRARCLCITTPTIL